MLMFPRCLFLCFAMLLFSHPAGAQQIKLKNSFFGGYKYSVGGGEFEKVGNSGKDLKVLMEGNPAATSKMSSYSTLKTASMVAGIPGGALVGWVIGASIAGAWDENQDTYQVMLAVGIPLVILSSVFDYTANSKLKDAVKLYNAGASGRIEIGLPGDRPRHASSGLGVAVTFGW
jgi:hypothetical protein